MTYSLKNVKISAGLSEETTAFTATLYRDKKRVAHVSNHGHGAPNLVHFADREERRKFEVHVRANTEGIDDFRIGDFDPGMMEREHQYTCEMLEDYERMRWVKRTTRTHVLFRLSTDPNAYHKISKARHTVDEIKAHIQSEFGETVLEIYS